MELERLNSEFKAHGTFFFFFSRHLGFTLVFNGWTKTSFFKHILKSTCIEMYLLSYLLRGEIILTLILHKQKHILCIDDMLVP